MPNESIAYKKAIVIPSNYKPSKSQNSYLTPNKIVRELKSNII